MDDITQMAGGMHFGVPEAVYHQKVLGMVSKGAIDRILRSPAHYLTWIRGVLPEERSPALDFGKAAHFSLLEPDVFARTYVVAPEFGSCRANAADGTTTEQGRENKLRKAAWHAEHVGVKHLLSHEDMMNIIGMRESLAAHPLACSLLTDGKSEVTLRWTDPDTRLECKARLDYDLEDVEICADLKTCADASPSQFAADVRKYGYRRQAAHYLDGMARCGKQRTFLFVCVEKEPPYPVAVYRLDDEAIWFGARQVDAAKRTLAGCMASGLWPAYGDGILPVGLEKWEMTK